ncbi:cache domain-containing sensor histidine kinase [Paenibacillus whitsoniae]|uniref:Sensor histidine kinase n=1 Tax=Paenibacillus whitsoniae TaxID=2496558 RepID=A0A3S0A6C0_9BACL|nr:sensor histidine kinase [Paenibacillus whitsoniae]RTE10599.1 sensor histidine kinase [Paenibacillus whitsoniae]
MFSIFKRVRIGRLFFGSFALFIALLLLVFTWISYHVTSSELAQNTSLYQQDLLNELNKKLVIQLTSIEQMSLAAARNIDIIGFNPLENDLFERNRRKKDLEDLLASITYSSTFVQSVHLYIEHPVLTDPQGPVRYFDLKKLKDESWYPEIQNNDLAWIKERTIETNVGELPVTGLARKLYNNSGIYYGLLLLNVKSSEIKNVIQGETEGRSRALFDAGGREIAAIGDLRLQENEFKQITMTQGKSGSIRIKTNQQSESLLVWSKSPANWMLVEVTPWKQIVQSSVRLAYILVTVGLSAICVASLFTLILSRQFTRPIKLLVAYMGKLPEKGLQPELPMDYSNEFGNLFGGYRKQMERIEELVKSLKEQHKRQREAEIQALQAMINPHFLYNTLDQLNWLAIDSGQVKISKILSLMGKMFRIGLSNGETMIPIADEITHVECYLQIQQIRWGERLAFEIEVEEEAKDLLLPRMTIQPMIENAIIHGFHGRKKGRIKISIRLHGQDVLLQVIDDGVGLRQGWDEPRRRKTGGYGLRNVRERTAAYFGAPYGVDIQSEPGEGTVVTIRLPQIRDKDEVRERYDVEDTHHR